MKFTNEHGIHLAMSVFLIHDNYDYDHRENAISATGLLKTTRQIVLSGRATNSTTEVDIADFVPSGLGNAVHDAIENSWLHGNHIKALEKLGYHKKMIDRVVINPTVVNPGDIPIYLEKRTERIIDGYYVSGKFDFCGDGELVDHKTTGVYGYMNKSNDLNYKLQGSIYRWLNPKIITSDHIVINYFFTDWSKLQSMIQAKKGYPAFRSMAYKVPLMSLAETESFIRMKIADVIKFSDKPDTEIPLCGQEDLWQGKTLWKYYKNPTKKSRATKNFDNPAEAHSRLIKDGSIGVVDEVRGMAKRCNYCNAASICGQCKSLILSGLVNLEG